MIEIEQKGYVFLGILIILSSAVWLGTRTIPADLPAECYEKQNYVPGSVEGFYRTPPQDIEQLINNNPSVVIIDCSSRSADFLAGKTLPNAKWSTTPSVYYGQNMVLILYSSNDDDAIDFATDLVGKMYGQVHVLLGGYPTWDTWINREI